MYSLKSLINERHGVEALGIVIMNFKDEEIDGYDDMVTPFYSLVFFTPKKLDLDLKN